MPSGLTFPVVAVLNGNIHVVGGGSSGGATDLHFRYRPSTGNWDTMPPVPYLAQQPAGAVVNGKLHVCGGGFPNSGNRLADHFIYDPDSNSWTRATNLPVATAIHKAVAFDNKLYVLTGQPNKQSCLYYDQASKTWTQRNNLPDMHFWYSAIVADANAIYRFGGGGYTVPQKLAHQYDKTNDAWNALPDLPLALHALDGCLINDSLIYLGGGYNVSEKSYMWIYNVRSKTYHVTKSLPVARNYHYMVSIDNCVYLLGGNNNAFPNLNVSLQKLCPGNSPLSTASLFNGQPYSMAYRPGESILHLENDALVNIFDLNGRTVFKRHSAGDLILRYEDFHAGMYTIQIRMNGAVYTEKWIVTE